MITTRNIAMGGKVNAVLIPAYRKAPLIWTLKNVLSWRYMWGLVANKAAVLFSKITRIPTLIAELKAVKIDKAGHRIDYGVVSRRVVTTTGVTHITDAWRNSVELEIMKYHGAGTGTNTEAAAETALATESTTALNPDSTRATGSLAGATTTFQSVGTLIFDASTAVIEHGLFSQAATGGGTMFDRSQFAAINVVSGDSIQFTYTVTFTAGG